MKIRIERRIIRDLNLNDNNSPERDLKSLALDRKNFQRLQGEMDWLLDGFFSTRPWLNPGVLSVRAGQYQVWSPATDVYEIEDTFVVKVEIAGMQEQNFHIYLVENHLIIEGVREDDTTKRAYQQMSISYGRFRTVVHIPGYIDEERVEANYREGFLTVLLPKGHRRERQIPITAD
ncbi:MAG: Hsp20/alpha crystallin family protein [Chloroflexi bacterium]|nr:Hsp20/alpha crystallin family protein [Chloroflexota bacterium]